MRFFKSAELKMQQQPNTKEMKFRVQDARMAFRAWCGPNPITRCSYNKSSVRQNRDAQLDIIHEKINEVKQN